MSRAPGGAKPAESTVDNETGAPPRPPLDVVQQWFQAVVTHPAGVAAGAASEAAQSLVRLDRGALERLVRRSSRLTAEQRLEIYANAYYARLLECLRDGFPVLTQVLGAEAFDSFAFDYLQRYPSRSYTLNRLAESFPRFLEETRPDRPPAPGNTGVPAPLSAPVTANRPPAGQSAATAPLPSWPDFLIDLATLELAIAEVFDGPGSEGERLLAPADLAAGTFAEARLEPVPCLRLLRFRYPVNTFYTAARAAADAIGADGAGGTDLPFPDPAEEHVALSRADFVVRRYTVSPFESAVLAALLAGAPVGEAIAGAAAVSDLPDSELATQLDAAFRRWTAAGFFFAAAVP